MPRDKHASDDTPMAAMVAAVSELASVVLELSPLRVDTHRASSSAGLSGAEVVIETKDREYELMILTDDDARREIERALLGPEIGAKAGRVSDAEATAESQRVTKKRTREAVCLLADIVANAFGRKLGSGNPTIRRPVFVEDFTRMFQSPEISLENVVLGEARLVLALSSSGKSRSSSPSPRQAKNPEACASDHRA